MVTNDNMDECKTRVNSATLTKLIGRPVILLGSVDQVDQTGMNLKVTASDGESVIVRLDEPLCENLDGVVEFHGISNGTQMNCKFYITFPTDYTENFDMESYDQAIKLIHSIDNNPWCFE